MASKSIGSTPLYLSTHFFNPENKEALHDIESLSDLSSDLRERLTYRMKTLSEKVKKLNDISKDALKEVSKIEDEVKKMVARVNAIADAQVC